MNLSDLAAMGAQPAWATLALTLPQVDKNWLRAFVDGFAALAASLISFVILVIFHFFVPFLALMSRHPKRRPVMVLSPVM